MKKITLFLIFAATSIYSLQSSATKCGEFIYNKKGMLKHYEWTPNSASENTKKGGVFMGATTHPSTENSTATVDPGVSTGATTGTTQSFSSYGDCSYWGAIKESLHGSYRHIYIRENLDGIKKQAALGSGGEHMASIAVMSKCSGQAGTRLGFLLQKNYSAVADVDVAHSDAFDSYVDHLISTDPVLSAQCAGA